MKQMTFVLEFPDAWKELLGLNADNATVRLREMIVIESYREGRLSRGQASEMLGLGFHEAERLFKRYGATQQASWEELEHSSQDLRSLMQK